MKKHKMDSLDLWLGARMAQISHGDFTSIPPLDTDLTIKVFPISKFEKMLTLRVHYQGKPNWVQIQWTKDKLL